MSAYALFFIQKKPRDCRVASKGLTEKMRMNKEVGEGFLPF